MSEQTKPIIVYDPEIISDSAHIRSDFWERQIDNVRFGAQTRVIEMMPKICRIPASGLRAIIMKNQSPIQSDDDRIFVATFCIALDFAVVRS